MKKICIFIGIVMIGMCMNLNAAENIIEAKTAQEVLSCIEQNAPNAIILFDIDDTIIAPASSSFRAEPDKQLIDQIKKDKHLYPNFENILCNWRLQRKCILVDNQWPNIINQLKKNHSVYALTKIDAGKFGKIESMEKWRFSELKNHHIEFSFNPAIEKHLMSDEFKQASKAFKNPPVFLNGIFITGSATKHEVLDQFNSLLNAKQLVLVDDRVEQLNDIQNFCEKHNIKFLGILFKGAAHLPGQYNPKIAEFQKNYLIKHEKWLEDAEAEKILMEVAN